MDITTNSPPGMHLLAPPASGETIVLFLHSGMFSLIHFNTAGSAYRLSTGMSKKPCRRRNLHLNLVYFTISTSNLGNFTLCGSICLSDCFMLHSKTVHFNNRSQNHNPGWNPKLTTDYWKTFPRPTKEESGKNWTWTHSHSIGEGSLLHTSMPITSTKETTTKYSSSVM